MVRYQELEDGGIFVAEEPWPAVARPAWAHCCLPGQVADAATQAEAQRVALPLRKDAVLAGEPVQGSGATRPVHELASLQGFDGGAPDHDQSNVQFIRESGMSIFHSIADSR